MAPEPRPHQHGQQQQPLDGETQQGPDDRRRLRQQRRRRKRAAPGAGFTDVRAQARALAMGRHQRLGRDSPVRLLTPDLLTRIMQRVVLEVPSSGCPTLRAALRLAFDEQRIRILPGDHAVGAQQHQRQHEQQEQQQRQQQLGAHELLQQQPQQLPRWQLQDQSGATIVHLRRPVHIFGGRDAHARLRITAGNDVDNNNNNNNNNNSNNNNNTDNINSSNSDDDDDDDDAEDAEEEECVLRGMLVAHANARGGSLRNLTLVDSGDCNLRLLGGEWRLERCVLKCGHGAALHCSGAARVRAARCTLGGEGPGAASYVSTSAYGSVQVRGLSKRSFYGAVVKGSAELHCDECILSDVSHVGLLIGGRATAELRRCTLRRCGGTALMCGGSEEFQRGQSLRLYQCDLAHEVAMVWQDGDRPSDLLMEGCLLPREKGRPQVAQGQLDVSNPFLSHELQVREQQELLRVRPDEELAPRSPPRAPSTLADGRAPRSDDRNAAGPSNDMDVDGDKLAEEADAMSDSSSSIGEEELEALADIMIEPAPNS